MQAGITKHSSFTAVSWILGQKIEIWGIIFGYIFTKEPGKPMFSAKLNMISTIILTRFYSS